MRRSLILIPLLFVVVACGEKNPTAPTPTPTPIPTSTPTGARSFDLSAFVGTWNLTLNLAEVKGDGGGCVGATMRSLIGVPTTYSLTITADGVTITNPNLSGGYACTFSGAFKANASSFTTFGTTGTYWCEPFDVSFRCSDG